MQMMPPQLYRNSSAHLVELNAPSGTVEQLEDELSDIQDLDTTDMDDVKEPGLIAA
jgi:hypothetical protein